MKVLPNGYFEVGRSETITFTVTRKTASCKASFDCQGWANCGPMSTAGAHTKIKTCSATANKSDSATCTINVDFRNDTAGSFDPGDKYTVTVTGNAGTSFTDTFSPPPVLNGQTYDFSVE